MSLIIVILFCLIAGIFAIINGTYLLGGTCLGLGVLIGALLVLDWKYLRKNSPEVTKSMPTIHLPPAPEECHVVSGTETITYDDSEATQLALSIIKLHDSEDLDEDRAFDIVDTAVELAQIVLKNSSVVEKS